MPAQKYGVSVVRGKRASQPAGARLAAAAIKPPEVQLALIKVDIARLGELEAMVDSGASCTIVRDRDIKGLRDEGAIR